MTAEMTTHRVFRAKWTLLRVVIITAVLAVIVWNHRYEEPPHGTAIVLSGFLAAVWLASVLSLRISVVTADSVQVKNWFTTRTVARSEIESVEAQGGLSPTPSNRCARLKLRSGTSIPMFAFLYVHGITSDAKVRAFARVLDVPFRGPGDAGVATTQG